jgi:hypothetical protein
VRAAGRREAAAQGVAFAGVDLQEDRADVLGVMVGGAADGGGGVVRAAVVYRNDFEGDVAPEQVADRLDVPQMTVSSRKAAISRARGLQDPGKSQRSAKDFSRFQWSFDGDK